MKKWLIGISGKMGSGKDTVGTLIQAQIPRKLRRYSFATPLKEGVKAMFGWNNITLEDRKIKEEIDPFWGFSPRTAMRYLGTEFGRQLLRDDIWILAAEKFHDESIASDFGTIITDVRFQNEADWIRSRPDGILIHIVDPVAVLNNRPEHASEAGIEPLEGELIIQNNKGYGMAPLTSTVSQFVENSLL